MSKKEYIENKIDSKENKYANVKEKYSIKDIVSTLAFLTTGLAAIIVLSVNTPISIALGTITALIGSYRYKNIVKNNNVYERYEKELKHLRNLQEEEKDNEVNPKLSKAKEASETRKNYERKYDDASTITGFTYAIAAIGSLATALNPEYVWIPIMGIAASLVAGAYEVKVHKDRETIKRKMNNLITDLDIEKIEKEEEKELVKEDNNEKEMDIPEYYYDGFDKPEVKEKPKTYYKSKRD